MATIDELKPEQLRDPAIFEKINELAYPLIFHLETKQAYFLQEKLKSLIEMSDIADSEPELFKNYQNLIEQLKWVSLPMLSEDEALKTLSESYLLALDNEDINIIDRLETRMFGVGLIPRDELRQKMQRALRENKERLGNKTFGEWLLDYGRTFDFRERDEMTHLKYIRQSPEVQSLSEPEKNKLRKAFQIFDKTLLVTPVLSEPELSMAVREMIKGGIIKKEEINPALLKSFVPPPKKVAGEISKIPYPEIKKLEIKKEIKPIPLELKEKPKKPGLFERLFAKKEEKAVSPYEKTISPYEVKRELPKRPSKIASILTRPVFTIDVPHPKPPTPKEITTFEEEFKEEPKAPPPPTPQSPQAKPQFQPLPTYRIRTMKGDIEKITKQPIPPKPEPKIKDNIVDLSGK